MNTVFHTNKTTIRCIESHEIKKLSKLTFESPKVMRNVFDGKAFTQKNAYDYIEQNFPEDNVNHGFWVIEDNSQKIIIGFCCVIPFDFSFLAGFEVGIVLGEKYLNKGYGTEAVNGLLNFCKYQLHLEKIYATASPANKFSIKVIHSMGLTPLVCKKTKSSRYNILNRGERIIFQKNL